MTAVVGGEPIGVMKVWGRPLVLLVDQHRLKKDLLLTLLAEGVKRFWEGNSAGCFILKQPPSLVLFVPDPTWPIATS